MLVTVPRVLQSLKQKIERDLEDGGKIEDFTTAVPDFGRETLSAPVVDFSRDSAAVWVEVLGIYLRRRGAGCGD